MNNTKRRLKRAAIISFLLSCVLIVVMYCRNNTITVCWPEHKSPLQTFVDNFLLLASMFLFLFIGLGLTVFVLELLILKLRKHIIH